MVVLRNNTNPKDVEQETKPTSPRKKTHNLCIGFSVFTLGTYFVFVYNLTIDFQT